MYQKLVIEEQTAESYGTNLFRRVGTDYADRVFMVVDSSEQEPMRGWKAVGPYIVGLDLIGLSGIVDLHYYDAYTLPDDDVTDAGIPAIWTPLIVLGALIEALESRQDSGVRGDEQPVGNNVEVPLLDRLIARYERLRDEMQMSLPSVYV